MISNRAITSLYAQSRAEHQLLSITANDGGPGGILMSLCRHFLGSYTLSVLLCLLPDIRPLYQHLSESAQLTPLFEWALSEGCLSSNDGSQGGIFLLLCVYIDASCDLLVYSASVLSSSLVVEKRSMHSALAIILVGYGKLQAVIFRFHLLKQLRFAYAFHTTAALHLPLCHIKIMKR